MKTKTIMFAFFFLVVIIKTNTQAQQPNIILILADDVGYKTLNVNGGKSYSTPNLNAMAQQGMNFTQCHASPLCSPSRVMLLTGKYNFRNYTKWGFMDKSQKTIGNMLRDAGYKTACFGKWQLSGGGTSIQTFGFDQYCVWNPSGGASAGSVYKSPHLYTNGGYISDNLTANKYGEDIFTDSVLNFIEKNKSVPFFIYYPMGLGHTPFQPTPDDSDFASWNSTTLSDTTYYPSMIKYMDKKVQLILDKIKALGIESNTMVIYTGDNGTPGGVSSIIDDDSTIKGGKSQATELGTKVPLIIRWPGVINEGSKNDDPISFIDFLPTLANIANIPLPANYGTLDGVDFSERLKGNVGTPRDWLFYHYDPYPGNTHLLRWAQTSEYKLYDTSFSSQTRLFYNIKNDAKEKFPIPDESLTPEELTIRQQLLAVMNNYVAQGFALLADPLPLKITNASADIRDSVEINGGSTITASGVVWGTDHNPVLSSGNYTSDNVCCIAFTSTITNLAPSTNYYVRTYATNI